MFKLKKPCNNCPFVKGAGPRFQLHADRVREIADAPAFQCHKTVDYANFEDDDLRQGDKPQQCAGLMSVLHKEGRPNQIMQVGRRLGAFDPDKLDGTNTYNTVADAVVDHCMR